MIHHNNNDLHVESEDDTFKETELFNKDRLQQNTSISSITQLDQLKQVCSDLVNGDPSILPDGLLDKECRHPDQEEHDEVGHEEGATAIDVGYVRKAPDVAEAHCDTEAGEEEVALVAPGVPLIRGHLSRSNELILI